MAIIQDRDKQAITKILGDMQQPVTIVNFTQSFECDSCRDTRELLEELAGLSDKLRIETFDFVADKEKVSEFKVDKVPAVALVGDRDYGIRFYGIPSGYEFSSLLQDILMISSRDSGLSVAAREELRKVDKDVHLEVLVTPT